MEPVRVPTEIDTPYQLLLWSSDEFVPFMFFLVLGNISGHVILGAIVGAVIGHLYKRYKNTRPDGYLYHLFYWYGLGKARGISHVNPFKREFLP